LTDDIVENILKERYYQPGETCWEDIAKRVGNFIGDGKEERETFVELIQKKYIIPASPFLMNAGTNTPQLFSCFVLPIEDNIGSIFKFYADAATVFKFSGGVGASWSALRPKGAPLSGGGVTSGVLSFLNIYNELIETVSQGGKKKGASICLLDIEHPECKYFIRSKLIEGRFKNFNISPVVTDEFMNRVMNAEQTATELFDLVVDCTYNSSEPGLLFIDTINKDCSTPDLGDYEAVNPCINGHTCIVIKEDAKINVVLIKDVVDKEITIWNGFEWSKVTPKITGYNKQMANVTIRSRQDGWVTTSSVRCTLNHHWVMEDGKRLKTTELKPSFELRSWLSPTDPRSVIYGTVENVEIVDGDIDEVVYCLEEPKSHSFVANGILTGNCGERPLFPYESCCLTAIVVPKFIVDGKVDYINLADVVRETVRFLDNSMDKNYYPIPEIREATLKTRRLGAYITGFADALIMMGIRYGSIESIKFIDDVWGFINEIAWHESVHLGIEKGVFPAYYTRDPEIVPDDARNAAVTCLAPSGTTSIFAGVNWGIEPVYSFAQRRSEGAGQGFQVFYLFEEMLDKYYPDKKSKIIDHCAKYGTIQDIPYITDEIKNVFVTAHDLTYKDHIDVQAAFQKHCRDGSISKTISLPKTATKDDIRNAYIYAWESGCKGVTFYREGTRKGVYQLDQEENDQVIEIKNPVKYKLVTNPTGRILPKTPREVPSITYKRNTGCGKMMISIGEVNGRPHTIIIKNKGGCDAMTQALSELTSLNERYEVPQWNINKVLMGIRCSAAMKNPNSDGKSCAEILGRILNDFYPHEDEPPKDDEEPPKATSPTITIDYIESSPLKCPKCGETLIMAEGCMTCKNCSYSKCN